MARYDLEHYDGVLAFGRVIRDLYLREGWTSRAGLRSCGGATHVWDSTARYATGSLVNALARQRAWYTDGFGCTLAKNRPDLGEAVDRGQNEAVALRRIRAARYEQRFLRRGVVEVPVGRGDGGNDLVETGAEVAAPERTSSSAITSVSCAGAIPMTSWLQHAYTSARPMLASLTVGLEADVDDGEIGRTRDHGRFEQANGCAAPTCFFSPMSRACSSGDSSATCSRRWMEASTVASPYFWYSSDTRVTPTRSACGQSADTTSAPPSWSPFANSTNASTISSIPPL